MRIQILIYILLIYFTASVAAIAPSLVAVTSCLKPLTLLSPHAYIPFTLVWQSSPEIIYPFSSTSIIFLKFSFSGTLPIATNKPDTSIVDSFPSLSIVILSILFSPFNDLILVLYITSILLFSANNFIGVGSKKPFLSFSKE